MNKTASAAALITSTVLAANAQAGPIDTAPYTPMKEGYSWRYKVFGRDKGKRAQAGETLREIIGTREVDGRRHSIELIQIRLADPKRGVRFAPAPIRRFLGRDERGAIAIQDDGQETTEILLPPKLEVDQVWKPQGLDKGFATFDGFADIEACGKKYRRCIKVTTLSSFGSRGPSKAVIYYAKGVGMVYMRRDGATFELSALEKTPRSPSSDEVLAAAREALKREAPSILKVRSGAPAVEAARLELPALKILKRRGREEGGWRYELGFRARFRGQAPTRKLSELLAGRAEVIVVRDEDGRFQASLKPLTVEAAQTPAAHPAPSSAQARACVRAAFNERFSERVRAMMLAGMEGKTGGENEAAALFLQAATFSGSVTSVTIKGAPEHVAEGWVFDIELALEASMTIQGKVLAPSKTTVCRGLVILARDADDRLSLAQIDLRAPEEKTPRDRTFRYTIDMEPK